ncbi:LysR family transcriptional regulator [Actimicrobium antarcticum]|uniref:LysR family transcriptional regulator n=1 Tax=Actimicrobium antarcticum TaxID=1051899 RepID=A0ABP7U0C5_9BURK
MREPGTPTIDQLRVFVAVVDAGSFSRAAKELHRTQSVISYTIANLEAQLNVVLFDRSKRKPLLTAAGQLLLADARSVALKVDAMRARAKTLSEGMEGEVSLAVDVMFPTATLVRILECFQAHFPTVGLRLRIEALGAVTQLVLDGVSKIGVSGWMINTPDAIERQALGSVRLVPVAAPGHPLAREPAPIPTAIAREHTQLVLTDRSTLTAGSNFGVFAMRDWRLGDLGAKHALLRSGLGWGHMPEAMVETDLTSGRLVRLVLAEIQPVIYPLYLIQRVEDPPGQAGRWLIQQLREQAPEVARPS